MNVEREAQITERRAQIPRKYRSLYDRAVRGRSLRACVNAQCLECVGWVSKEVTFCTDRACPLWTVRPYRDPGSGRDGHLIGAESRIGGQAD